MNQLCVVLGLFLYFPEDKTEYIPAAITMVVFTIAAFFAFRFIVKLSKKEQGKVDELLKQSPENKGKE
jgi:phosphotransferase system  glucose/maltose/N-acetylglucosamine-specific IIC component